MPVLTPAELADALYCRGERPIDGARVTKALRHLETAADYRDFLAALPSVAQTAVELELQTLMARDPALRRRVEAWG